MKNAFYYLFLAFFLFSCNKENKYADRLMSYDIWDVKSLSVDDQQYGIYGSWLPSSSVDIYKSVPTATWHESLKGGKQTTFQWQFGKKGKTFILAFNNDECINCGTKPSDLDLQCYYLSGTYKVIDHKKHRMEFTSTETIGFPGKLVRIIIERLVIE